MSKPDILVFSVLERYVRPDLAAFTRTSPEMHYDRSQWGKNKGVKRTSFEDITLTEDVNLSTKRSVSESIVIKDNVNMGVTRLHEERISLSDDYARGLKNTTVEDAIKLFEDEVRKPKRTHEERIFIFDQDERQPNTVIYDIEFSNTPLSEEDFDKYHESSSPLGYSEIRPLIPGEYEYKDAIVGVQVKLADSQGRFGILGSKLVLDVEDVVQKGRVTLSGGKSERIKFDKKFYTIPHILTSFVESSRVGVIEVSEVDREGFTVGIKEMDGSGGYIDGTIDYLADGY